MAGHRMYVGNIPAWLLSEKKARDFFEKYGNIDTLVIHRDLRDTQAPGFCYITYETIEMTTKAVEELNSAHERNESQMIARRAFARGSPHVEDTQAVHMIDKLHHTSQRQSLSQNFAEDDDDDELFNSLSQRFSQGSRRRSSGVK